MSFWWVTQNKSSEEELRGGYMWAPKLQRNGWSLSAYTNVSLVKTNDIIFSYVHSEIVAVGIALSDGYSSPKPHSQDTSDVWQKDGWRVDVDYTLTPKRYRPSDNFGEILPLLPDKYSPLVKSTGRGAQGMYLTSISDLLAMFLFQKIGISPDDLYGIEAEYEARNIIQDEIEILNNPQLSETTKERLVLSRIGQGLFRKRVKMFESACRVTGLQDEKFLVASHIKPWSISNPSERLDGNNGLLLSPHADRLFDRGYMSFTQKGEVLFSPRLNLEVLNRWSLNGLKEVGQFSDAQEHFLEHHRSFIFQD
jgi:hypothetical protein